MSSRVIVFDKHGAHLEKAPVNEQPADDTGETPHRFTLEQDGLHAVLLLRFSLSGLHPNSKVIFPTQIVSPRDPRGYLSAQLALPEFVGGFRHVTYDGVAVRATITSGPDLSLFASPSHPTVWAILTYKESQEEAAHVGGARRRTILIDSGGLVWKSEQWVSNQELHIAFTTAEERVLTQAIDDLSERARLTDLWKKGVEFECPEKEVTSLLHFAKIRAQESVYDAKNLGRVHSPGGGMFYSGVWCNDEAEYASPALAMLGGIGSRSRKVAVDSLLALARAFDREHRIVPYSVEIDGGYVGRLDRGDAGMFAWGASLTMLTISESPVTELLFPHIKYTCDILEEKIQRSKDGVVMSESDELEGRFPSGDANFSVNCISIMAFEAASEAALEAKELNAAHSYKRSAIRLRESTDRYFSTAGPECYAYYKGCPDARGWGCLAALAGLPRGKEAVQYCLDHLWSIDGILTSSQSADVWDRCSLYGIRAGYRAGMVEKATHRFSSYSRKRITEGPAAPYAVENNSSFAQLSAESALAVRVVTEGLLGICVKHGKQFTIRPQCPPSWPGYAVKSAFIAQFSVDFQIQKNADSLDVKIRSGTRTAEKAVLPGSELIVLLNRDPLLSLASAG